MDSVGEGAGSAQAQVQSLELRQGGFHDVDDGSYGRRAVTPSWKRARGLTRHQAGPCGPSIYDGILPHHG